MKRVPFLLAGARPLVTVMILALLGCPGGGSTQPETGTLKVVVTIDGSPAQGIAVTANGPGSQQGGSLAGTSDVNGVVEWMEVEVGTYAVHLEQPLPSGVTFPETTKIVTVSASGVVTVVFEGTSALGTIQGTVTIDGQGAAGVTVTIDGPDTAVATTDAGGSYTFVNLQAGSYTVTISDFPGGVTFGATSKPVTLSPGGVATVEFIGTS